MKRQREEGFSRTLGKNARNHTPSIRREKHVVTCFAAAASRKFLAVPPIPCSRITLSTSRTRSRFRETRAKHDARASWIEEEHARKAREASRWDERRDGDWASEEHGRIGNPRARLCDANVGGVARVPRQLQALLSRSEVRRAFQPTPASRARGNSMSFPSDTETKFQIDVNTPRIFYNYKDSFFIVSPLEFIYF